LTYRTATRGLCFDPTRVHLKRCRARSNWNRTAPLRPHKGPSETAPRIRPVPTWSLLRPHKGPSETRSRSSGPKASVSFDPTRVHLKLISPPPRPRGRAGFDPTRVHLKRRIKPRVA